MVETRDTRYAKTPDGVYLAYQTVGDGPIDFACQFNDGDIDLLWEHPYADRFLSKLQEFSRLILHDRRGVGLSSRNVPQPNLETRASDLLTVLDAAASERPILYGGPEPGAANAYFAAIHPDRVSRLVWFGASPRLAWAPDYPWGLGPDYFDREMRSLQQWGTREYGEAWQEMEATIWNAPSDEEALYASLISRHTTTPDVAMEFTRTWYETDVRSVLPSIQTPTLLLTGDAVADHVDETKYVASLLPNATVHILKGQAGWDWEHSDRMLDAIRVFAGIETPPADIDTILSSVMFTDIVGSTAMQASMGDHSWKDLVQRHHATVRHSLDRWRGTEMDTAGDGFYATFDGPARAIRCAQEIRDRLHDLGIEVRAGVHTGECEVINDKVGGIAVTIGARIAALAGPSEILISQTVKDLVAGSGLTFEAAGVHELKGIPDRWHVYRVLQ
jgi:class 3 adenylate cyclase/pimeloyl-ACP methyl ester carboxylesterase